MTVLLLFSSPHSCSTGFRSEDWNGHSRSLVLCSVTHFCVVFEVCFWIIVHWKIQTWPIIRFLKESVTWFFYLLVFDRIHDAMCLNKMSSRNIGPQHKNYSSIFNCTHGVLLYLIVHMGYFYPGVHQTHLECLLLKSSFFCFIWP